jgi:hypothetical protein
LVRRRVFFDWHALAAIFAFSFLLPAAWAGGIVNDCTETALRSAMVGGGTVTFACDGTITLASTVTNLLDTTLDGTGHLVTISGGNAVRVFYIPTNIHFSTINLTIANGASQKGAGIFNAGGVLRLVATTFRANAANFGPPGGIWPAGEGGAIYNQAGAVEALNCSFTGNRAQQLINCDDCMSVSQGGAIYNGPGQLRLWNCTFTDNQALGVNGLSWDPYSTQQHPLPPATAGLGGAIFNDGTLNATFCSFRGNSARGGAGGQPGLPCSNCSSPGISGTGGNGGVGGAIYGGGVMEITSSAFFGNVAASGGGGKGGTGAAYSIGTQGGAGGSGGSSSGAAFFNVGASSLVNCTFASNVCSAADGGQGGTGGATFSSQLAGGQGGHGGIGGSGNGALDSVAGKLTLLNCTVVLNQAVPGAGGAGGAGGPGGPGGGGQGQPGTPGSNGSALGGLVTSTSTIANTIFATNPPGGNCSGAIQDGGHNLSSDASCAFTNLGGFNFTDPQLGPAVANGGPTLTLALLPASPAINAASLSNAPATDQRGFPRPKGAPDIGAFEYNSTPVPTLQINFALSGGLDIFASGATGQNCVLLTSANLSTWLPLATNLPGPDGLTFYHDGTWTAQAVRFYRALSR